MMKFAAFAVALLLPTLAWAQTSPSPPSAQTAPDPRLMPDTITALQAQLMASQAQMRADQATSTYLSDQNKFKQEDWEKTFAAWCDHRPACGLPPKVAQQSPAQPNTVAQPTVPHFPYTRPTNNPSSMPVRSMSMPANH